jgi:hypothetical protein
MLVDPGEDCVLPDEVEFVLRLTIHHSAPTLGKDDALLATADPWAAL